MKKTDSMKEQSAHPADVLSGEDGLVGLRMSAVGLTKAKCKTSLLNEYQNMSGF